jgi:uncharacterized MAPEG superfamily protein
VLGYWLIEPSFHFNKIVNFLNLPTPAVLLGSIGLAAALIYFPYLLVVVGRFQVGYDMGAPRSTFDKLPDYAKRANWAHQNSFETFVTFAAAALMAYVTKQDSAYAANLAIAFVVARLLFSVFYIINFPIGRSLMFGVGSFATATLMIISITSALG